MHFGYREVNQLHSFKPHLHLFPVCEVHKNSYTMSWNISPHSYKNKRTSFFKYVKTAKIFLGPLISESFPLAFSNPKWINPHKTEQSNQRKSSKIKFLIYWERRQISNPQLRAETNNNWFNQHSYTRITDNKRLNLSDSLIYFSFLSTLVFSY